MLLPVKSAGDEKLDFMIPTVIYGVSDELRSRRCQGICRLCCLFGNITGPNLKQVHTLNSWIIVDIGALRLCTRTFQNISWQQIRLFGTPNYDECFARKTQLILRNRYVRRYGTSMANGKVYKPHLQEHSCFSNLNGAEQGSTEVLPYGNGRNQYLMSR